MEQNFETSFIPKKPVVNQEKKVKQPIGLFTVIAILAFATVALSYGGLYFYKKNLADQIVEKSEQIRLAEGSFETSRIYELQVLGRRLSAAREILDKHIAVTPIFQELSLITRKRVAYLDFNYEFKLEEGGDIVIKMKGIADGYSEVALQADLFDQNENFKEPIFSNLALDERGSVLFDLEFVVDPVFVDYRQMIQTRSDDFLNTNPAPTVIEETQPLLAPEEIEEEI